MKCVVLPVLLLAALAMAQYWEIERVDSAGWGASVQMRRHPDGRLILCYSNASGGIRLASRDTVWRYEDLPQWRPALRGTQAFDIDRDANIGVGYIGVDNRFWLMLGADSAWVDIATPFSLWVRSPVTLDTAGCFVFTVQESTAFLLARRTDTSWATDTIDEDATGMSGGFGCSCLGARSDGSVWGVFWFTFSWPGRDIHGTSLYTFESKESGITVTNVVPGIQNNLTCAAGCIDVGGAVRTSYGNYDQGRYWGVYLDQTQLDSELILHTAVRFDSTGLARVAYTGENESLRFCYQDAVGWHFMGVGVGRVKAHDLGLATDGAPLISYTTPDGVFLAHGVDVVGTEAAGELAAFGSRPTATIIRGVLRVSPQPTASSLQPDMSLLDISGRKVMTLHAGARCGSSSYDVRRLAPGVYFVRETSAASCRKVILTR